jgi:hypothetical protein
MFALGSSFSAADKQTAMTFSLIARIGKSFFRIPTSERKFLPAIPDLSPLLEKTTSDKENDSAC